MLQTQGYTVQARNYSWRGGEIDIIAQKDNSVMFIEVKMRQHHYFSLSEIITSSKQRKIIATARKYIHENASWHETIYRFDVALLELLNDGTYTTTYIPNAFTAPTDLL
jgi:putative endonuclease